MKKAIATIAAVSMMICSAASCGNGNNGVLGEKSSSGAGAMADVAFDLLREENRESDKNILISPDSITSAMMLVEMGAKGNTLSEIEKAVNRGVSQDQYIDFLRELHIDGNTDKDGDEEDCEEEDRKNKYYVANSVWVKDAPGIQLNKEFEKDAVEKMGADIFLESFQGETVEKMNSWVKQKTGGMIPEIVDDLDESSVLAIINTAFFSSQWCDPFERTAKEKFTNENGKETEVEMMSREENYYITINGGKGFIKDYKNGFCFVGILPPEGKDIDKFIEGLKGKEFTKAFLDPDYAIVNIKVPKFSYDYQSSLLETLSNMGIKQAFSPQADFSGALSGDNAYIQTIIHKTCIDLDEDGTSAAAATYVLEGVGALGGEHPKEIQIYLDRPFVYAIADKKTGAPIFVGAVKDLS